MAILPHEMGVAPFDGYGRPRGCPITLETALAGASTHEDQMDPKDPRRDALAGLAAEAHTDFATAMSYGDYLQLDTLLEIGRAHV